MRFKKFTSHTISFYRIGLLALLVALVCACNKDDAPGPPSSLTRLSEDIKFDSRDTAITLRWRGAITAWEGETIPNIRYEVNISSDPDYEDESQTALTLEIDSPFISLNKEQLVPLQEYYARVRSVVGPNEARSGWLESDVFMILDKVPEIKVLRPVKNQEITDNMAIVRWGTDEEHAVTHYVLTEGEQEGVEVELSTGEVADGTKTLEGLTSNQAYTIQLFAGDREMGTETFTTKRGLGDLGSVVDLRTSSDPMILQNTLNTVPDGSIIALKRGMTYTITETFKLDRGVTVMSEPGFGPQAHLEMSSSFDVEGVIDVIKFEDVEITGDMGGTYVFNLATPSTINQIILEACTITNQRGVLRLKDAGVKTIGTYVINNSIVQNIGGYNVLMVDNSDASVDAVSFTNSTFINIPDVIRYGNSVPGTLNSVVVANATFFQAPNDNKYFINMQRTGSVIGSLNMSNTLFGYTDGGRAFNRFAPNSITTTNSFATSDANWDRGLVDGVTAHSATSEQVFAAPDKTDFANSDLTITDEELFTVGDPRWRP